MSEFNNDAVNCSPCHTGGNPQQHGFLRRIFKKCAACGGSVAGGALAGHLGCIIMPFLAVTGMATGLATGLGFAFGAAAAAGGVYLWHRLRGQKASKWEKRIVIGSAIAGLTLSSAFNFFGGKYDHHQVPKDPIQNVDTVKTFKLPVAPKCDNGCCGK